MAYEKRQEEKRRKKEDEEKVARKKEMKLRVQLLEVALNLTTMQSPRRLKVDLVILF